MEKTKIIRYGTIALILFFAFEYLWPLLYAPTQNNPTPSPSPEAALDLNTVAEARVKELGNRLVFFCSAQNANATTNLKQDFESIEGVERAFQNNGVYDISLSGNNTDFALVESARIFYGACPTGLAFRKANSLEFQGIVSFNDTQGEPRSLRLPSNLCSQPYWTCLVFLETQRDSLARVSVSITENRGVQEGIIQQIQAIAAPPANSSQANSS